MTELLAPAGSFDALRAAIANGADAVYLGGKSFSARAFADNFTLEELADAVRLAHFYGVKVYVTANTLIGDRELVSFLFYMAEMYKIGVDAVIIQDIGLLDLIKETVPGLHVHASTQMTVHNAAALRLLKDEGVQRAILARELSFEDIRSLQNAEVLPLEIFVHGALCVCYSGQCLFSSMVGGRSGNRGRCAQPCRMAYRLVDEFGDDLGQPEGKYLLSPRDLFGYSELSDLYALGVASWKIEGRMKKPHYVATVSRIYGQALRSLEAGRTFYPSREDERQLLQVFNRDRSSGYWRGNPGAALISYSRPNNRGLFLGRILEAKDHQITLRLSTRLNRCDGVEIWVSGKREGCTVDTLWVDGQQVEEAQAGQTVTFSAPAGYVGDRVFKTYDAPLMEKAELSYENLPDKALDFTVSATIGAPLSVSVQDPDGYRASRSAEYVVEMAKKPASVRDIACSQLGRLGGTGYCLGKLTGALDENALLPASVLNQLRRELVEDLLAQRKRRDRDRPFDEAAFSRQMRSIEPAAQKDIPRSKHLQTSVLVHTAALLEQALRRGYTDIYFDVCGFQGTPSADIPALAAKCAAAGAKLIPYLPQIILPREEASFLSRFRTWKAAPEIEAVCVNNLGQLRLLQEQGWNGQIYTGSGLNVFNSAACRFLSRQGVSRIALSPELTLTQLEQLDPGAAEIEVFVQGALPIMVSEYCLLGAVCGGRTRDAEGDHLCQQPCRKNRPAFLLDEKGYAFPVREDKACRMHIFNSREHCLLEELPALREAGVDRVLLDLRLYDERKAAQMLDLYRGVTDDDFAFAEARRRLPSIIKDYTKGHLFRGV